jgi:hypothetical protein
MKCDSRFYSLRILGTVFLLAFGFRLAATPSPTEDITAVSAKVSKDYIRLKSAAGSYPVEYYAFGDGGHYGGPMGDQTIDPLKFTDVAHVIARPLADQNYRPAEDPATTKLLIMVYWGLTFVPGTIEGSPGYNSFGATQNSIAQTASQAKVDALDKISVVASGYHSLGSGSSGNATGLRDDQLADQSSQLTMLSMLNEQRDQTDFATAKLLGYDSDDAVGTEHGNYIRGTALRARHDDLLSEIEDNRYFVVLMAYDFQLLWKQKKHKLLWETRFSIRQNHHQFDKDLPGMALYASQYFGQDTHGLVRKELPLGHVDVGAIESLGVVSGKDNAK